MSQSFFSGADASLRFRAKAELEKRKRQKALPPIWTPNPDHEDGRPNPQRLAYESEADILGYGGAAGAGKSSLLLGLAATRHRHSAIFRRVHPNLRGIISESKALIGTRGVFNETVSKWSLDDGRVIEFESCQYEKDMEKQRGRPRDFYGFDEATEFPEFVFRFITAWLRSTVKGQRQRIVLTFNPPRDVDGSWVIEFFKPWFAYLFPEVFTHPHPAAPGELRWYATINGDEVELESSDTIEVDGETIQPLSRTFIPGRLTDNPYLRDGRYSAVLQSLPEPLRSQLLYGSFAAQKEQNPYQIIPTEWVQLAQKRWLEADHRGLPEVPTAVGVDVARGGKDRTVFSPRWDNFYGEPILYPGTETPTGQSVAALFQAKFPDTLRINIDVIGVGSSAYDHLSSMYLVTNPITVSAGSTYTDRSGKLKMKNLRTELLWRMRDSLDPSTNSKVCLPPSTELIADLCAPTYRMYTDGVVLAESKDDIQRRLKRSPDVGDALLLSSFIPEVESTASWADLSEDLSDLLSEPFWAR